jgi:hypothetical protein
MTRLTLRTDDLTWREIDGEIVALEGRRSMYLSANSSGGMLWHMLARGASRDEPAAALATSYGIDTAFRGDGHRSFSAADAKRRPPRP